MSESRKPGDDLRAYIKDARATLGLTPPEYDDLHAIEDAFTSLTALEDILEWATQSLDEPVKVTGNQDMADGYRSALLHVLAAAEDGIEDMQAVLNADPEDEGRPLSELRKDLGL